MHLSHLHFTSIVAMTAERVIGHLGSMPWHLPEDLKHFRETTLHHPILMGRKTFDSIGRALPKRQNIVLTRNRDWKQHNTETIHQIEDLAQLTLWKNTIFIIGGAEIYRELLPVTESIIVTHIKRNYHGDTYFPAFKALFPNEKKLQKKINFDIISYRK